MWARPSAKIDSQAEEISAFATLPAMSEARIKGFIDAYAPDVAAQLRACRKKLHALFPRGHELVYDNYNALVFAFGPTGRAGDIVLSIAGYPRWVTLFFLHGATLDDPEGLLEGGGKQVRGVRLVDAKDLDKPAVRALIGEALRPAAAKMKAADPRTTTIQSVSAKRRPRKPATAKKR
jgi:hypothetical protein